MPTKYHSPGETKTSTVRLSTASNNLQPPALKQGKGKKVSRMSIGEKKSFKPSKQTTAVRKAH